MFKPSKIRPPVEESFAKLIRQPWQAKKLLKYQEQQVYIKIFRVISLARAIIVISILLYFLLTDETPLHITLLTLAYSVLMIWLAIYTDHYKEQLKRLSLLCGLLELSLITYSLLYHGELELELVFFSLIVSATLLPLVPIILLYLIATLTVVINWAHIDLTQLGNFNFSQPLQHSGQVQNMLFEASTIKDLVFLLILLLFIVLIVNQIILWAFSNEIKSIFYYKQLRSLQTFIREASNNLKNGIILVDNSGKIIHINNPAMNLLNINRDKCIDDLKDLSPKLQDYYQDWLSLKIHNGFSYRHNMNAEEVYISFANFGYTDDYPMIMITLENIDIAIKQNQETKLVALGRMAASIAHEIRNPLTSVSSAAELLKEITQHPQEEKLSQLVLKNIRRANRVIDNMLGLFNKQQPRQVLLPLKNSLLSFKNSVKKTHPELELRITQLEKQSLFFYFDTVQLEQVLYNLVSNSIHHANVTPLIITIKTHLSTDQKNIYIDIMDNGNGINPEYIEHLFEPFFTRGSSGTGLGLYLVREICIANNAKIIYINQLTPKAKGTIFRIIASAYFNSDPQPKIN